MSQVKENALLYKARALFKEIVERADLMESKIEVKAKTLTAEEAIGAPKRRDYPIILGKESLIEARFQGTVGHAFTDMPGDYASTLGELFELELTDNAKRAFFIASMNAVYRHLHPEVKTAHCKDEDPEQCGEKIAKELRSKFDAPRVGLIGLNPAILENLASAFGPKNVQVADLNPDTIGKEKFGVLIGDGETILDDVIESSDVLVVTGTTLGNATIDDILSRCETADKPCIFFGVTIAAAAELMGLKRICPFAR